MEPIAQGLGDGTAIPFINIAKVFGNSPLGTSHWMHGVNPPRPSFSKEGEQQIVAIGPVRENPPFEKGDRRGIYAIRKRFALLRHRQVFSF